MERELEKTKPIKAFGNDEGEHEDGSIYVRTKVFEGAKNLADLCDRRGELLYQHHLGPNDRQ